MNTTPLRTVAAVCAALVLVGVARKPAFSRVPVVALEWVSLGTLTCNHVCSTCEVSSQHKNAFNDTEPSHEGGGHGCAEGDGTGCNPPAHGSCGGGSDEDLEAYVAALRAVDQAGGASDVTPLREQLRSERVHLNRERSALQVVSECGLVVGQVPVRRQLIEQLTD
jgi:hypothetical protein